MSHVRRGQVAKHRRQERALDRLHRYAMNGYVSLVYGYVLTSSPYYVGQQIEILEGKLGTFHD